MISFHVGVDKEEATTRLHNAIIANQSRVPLGVNSWDIQSIDPDNIPIFSFAISYEGDELDIVDQQRKLKTIALEVIDELKTVKNTTLRFHQGGQDEQLSVVFDLDALQAKNIDVLQVIQALQTQQRNIPVGSMKLGDTEAIITLDAAQDTLASLQQIIIANYNGHPIYLDDIAEISWKGQTFVPVAWQDDGEHLQESVFIGVAKKK